jgi:hypothetical protein
MQEGKQRAEQAADRHHDGVANSANAGGRSTGASNRI